MNENLVTKSEFMKRMGYSESTYQRRMKKFKSPEYRDGYIAQTPNEVYIDIDIYKRFMKDETAKRLHYQRI